MLRGINGVLFCLQRTVSVSGASVLNNRRNFAVIFVPAPAINILPGFTSSTHE